ncbi:MAG: NUDIX hydrolase [Thermodesulfobacteriota bacterium]
MGAEQATGLAPRRYPARPIVGVGGVIFDGPAVLLVKRAKDPGRGQWTIPGGAVKTGETLAEAVRREMAEEVGLAVSVGPLIEVVERIIPDEQGRVLYHYVILDFLCHPDGGALRPGSDADEARFVRPEEWGDYGQPGMAVRIFEKAAGMLRDSVSG